MSSTAHPVEPNGGDITVVPARCRSCRRNIIWAVHSGTGKAAPIDAEASEGGNIMLITPGPNDTKTTYIVLSPEAAQGYQGGDAHLNHFVTCPHAKDHHVEH